VGLASEKVDIMHRIVDRPAFLLTLPRAASSSRLPSHFIRVEALLRPLWGYGGLVEAAGIEPASEKAYPEKPTCVAVF